MKKINFNFGGEKLVFETSQSLFSSAGVDAGTKFLLNSLRKNDAISYGKILDVGCGYGPIGIFLKRQNSGADVLCVDRDSMAVEFAGRNAKLNGVEINTKWGLGYSGVGGKFDLIVSNFPAKAGANALKNFVYGASGLLKKDGIFAVVIVRRLESELLELLDDSIEVAYHETVGTYSVYHLKFGKNLEISSDPHLRNRIKFLEYDIETAYNLPEFDTPSFLTELFLDRLEGRVAKDVGVVNPNQGHLALGALKILKPKKMILTSRDLLSLEFSKRNLLGNGFENVESSDADSSKKDLVIWNVNKDEELELFRGRLEGFGKSSDKILIGGRASIIRRFLKKCGVKILQEKVKKGFLVGLIEGFKLFRR